MKTYRVYLAVNRPMEAMWEGEAKDESEAEMQARQAFERGECEIGDCFTDDTLAGGASVEEQDEQVPEKIAADGSIACMYDHDHSRGGCEYHD